MKKYFLPILCMLSFSIFAEETFQVKSRVDWSQQRLKIILQMPVGVLDVRSRSRAEDIIAVSTVRWLRQGVSSLILDSQYSVGDRWLALSRLSENNLSLDLEKMLEKGESFFDPQFSTFNVHYSIRLYPDFIYLWKKDLNSADKLPAEIEISDTPTYSGLLIDAREEKPLHGRAGEKAFLVAALFPRLLNEDMKLLIDKNHIDPLYLQQWGMIGYYQSDDQVSRRVGNFPLRVQATAYWGKYPSDILLSNKEVKKINSSTAGREALRQGRIAVILPPS